MRCNPNALSQQLDMRPVPLYLLFGTDAFLVQDSANLIRQHATHKQSQITTLCFEGANALSELTHCLEQPSLFASQQLIDIRLRNATPKERLTLSTLITSAPTSFSFIIQMGSLNRQQQQAKWFVALEKMGCAIPHWGLNTPQLAAWIRSKGAQLGVTLDSPAIESLLTTTEGNPQAAFQALQRLALLRLSNDTTTPPPENDYVAKQNQYEMVDLIVAALSQKPQRTYTIFQSLSWQQTALPLMIWSLTQTLRALLRCAQLNDDVARQHQLKRSGIFTLARDAHIKALKTPYPRLWASLLSALSEIDMAFKSGKGEAIPRQILDICLTLATCTSDKHVFGVWQKTLFDAFNPPNIGI